MIAIGSTVALVFGAFAAAFTLTWRGWAVEPVPVKAEIESPGCDPRVKR